MSKPDIVLSVIGALLLAALVIVGGYKLNWWLAKDTNNRRAQIVRTSYEVQTTYRTEMVRKIQDVKSIDVQLVDNDSAPLRAQRKAIVDIICVDNSHIQGALDPSTATFVAKECV